MLKLPCSFDAQSIAILLRETLENLNFKFEREHLQKYYTQALLIFPLPKLAYAFRFVVKEPSEFIIDLYDAKITHSGIMHFLELENITKENIKDIRLVLNTLIKKLPRKPWKFTIKQKLEYGFLAPEVITARRKWQKLIK
jgi:hypothetical protein